MATKNNFTMKIETAKFNRFLKSFVARSNLSTNLVIKKIALDLLVQILKRSPVDTGRSRAAWYPSMQGLGGSYDLQRKLKDPTKSKVSEGKKQGSYKENLKFTVNKYVELINGVDYIIYLEYGYSKQAPYGMVRISMRKMRGKMPKALNKEFRKDWNKKV